jgi:hypothetical protein
LAHDILVPVGIVDVLTLRVDVLGNGGFEAASPHGSISLGSTGAAASVAGAVLVSSVALFTSDALEAADAADAAETLEAVILAQEGASSTTVLSVFSETDGQLDASSDSVLAGRVLLSPPFWARGAPLVDPPRPPRKPSNHATQKEEFRSLLPSRSLCFLCGGNIKIAGCRLDPYLHDHAIRDLRIRRAGLDHGIPVCRMWSLALMSFSCP